MAATDITMSQNVTCLLARLVFEATKVPPVSRTLLNNHTTCSGLGDQCAEKQLDAQHDEPQESASQHHSQAKSHFAAVSSPEALHELRFHLSQHLHLLLTCETRLPSVGERSTTFAKADSGKPGLTLHHS